MRAGLAKFAGSGNLNLVNIEKFKYRVLTLEHLPEVNGEITATANWGLRNDNFDQLRISTISFGFIKSLNGRSINANIIAHMDAFTKDGINYASVNGIKKMPSQFLVTGIKEARDSAGHTSYPATAYKLFEDDTRSRKDKWADKAFLRTLAGTELVDDTAEAFKTLTLDILDLENPEHVRLKRLGIEADKK